MQTTKVWLSGFFCGLAFVLGLFIVTNFAPSSENWGGVFVTGFMGLLLILANVDNQTKKDKLS